MIYSMNANSVVLYVEDDMDQEEDIQVIIRHHHPLQ